MDRLKTYLVVVGLLLAIAASGLALREHARALRAEAALADAGTRAGALEHKLQAAKADLARIAAERGAPTAATARPPAADLPPHRGRRMDMPDFSSDPEIAPLLLRQRQRQISNRYALLFSRLGLAAEQREKLEALLAEKQLSHFDAMGLARRQGLGRDEAMELARQSDAEADASILALLGDAGFAKLQEYDRSYAQRTTVNTIATQLGIAGAALSSDQQERLVSVLAAHSVADEPAGGPGGPGWRLPFAPGADQAEIRAFFESKGASDAEALQQASAFLNPAQLEAVRQAQQDETTQLQVAALRFDRMRRAQSANGGDAPPR